MLIQYLFVSKNGSREINEDYVTVKQIDETSFFALADGLGGHNAGEVASRLVCETAVRVFDEQKAKGSELIEQAYEASQKALLKEQMSDGQHHDMKTTLVLLTIDGGVASWGHIGDSRLYMFRDNRVIYEQFRVKPKKPAEKGTFQCLF